MAKWSIRRKAWSARESRCPEEGECMHGDKNRFIDSDIQAVLLDADTQAGKESTEGLDNGEEVGARWHNEEPVVQVGKRSGQGNAGGLR